eukprot:342507-Rhodomonas_salina.1
MRQSSRFCVFACASSGTVLYALGVRCCAGRVWWGGLSQCARSTYACERARTCTHAHTYTRTNATTLMHTYTHAHTLTRSLFRTRKTTHARSHATDADADWAAKHRWLTSQADASAKASKPRSKDLPISLKEDARSGADEEGEQELAELQLLSA